MKATPINLMEWVSQNKDKLQPPVSNWCLYKGDDFFVMVLGGPNERTDYHINETEVKGDMLLKIKDPKEGFQEVPIKEGQMFLLPSGIPHNPVRFPDTIGIVIERNRTPQQFDRLRWYCEHCYEVLHEDSFHCKDIETQLQPFLKKFKQDSSLRTCKNCNFIN